ncbi:hypothetical protein LIER_24328 [Lithospermum erythrorhizon]
MEYALCFNFEATNNEAEYEALVAGLELVRSLSKLMIDQIRGDYGIKNESLIKYHAKATTLARGFTYIVFEYMAHTENEQVDRLSKLATTYYDELPKKVYVEVRDQRAYEETPVKAVLEEPQDCVENQ